MDFRELLETIAKEFGVTPEEVYRDMQAAIDAGDKEALEESVGGTTPEEVVSGLAERVAKIMQKEEDPVK